MTNQQNIILEAIEMTTSNYWDLDDEYLSDAIQSQAELLAGLTADSSDTYYDFH